MTSLTKAMIMQGKGFTSEVELPEMGEGVTITIRPLTEGEYAKAQALEGAGLKFKGRPGQLKGKSDMKDLEMEMDIAEIQAAEFRAKSYVVSTCIVSDEQWTPEDVGMMRPVGVVDKLVEAIYDISGVKGSVRKQIDEFRQD